MNIMDDETMILLLCLGDLFLTGNEKQITGCKKKLVEEFTMRDIGLMHYLLGMEVWQSPEGISLNK